MSELLEKILNRENMNKAYKRVKANKGTSGIDEITIEDAFAYIKENWESIRAEITERKYKPQPVKRVEIPKPNGGTRNLGIPTVMDRIIQQAMVQVLSSICETFFSDYSYGFRPNRSCEQAIMKLLEYFNDGYEWIVDIDLEKFFDNVPQDKLMSHVHIIINDGDTESLIQIVQMCTYLSSSLNGQTFKHILQLMHLVSSIFGYKKPSSSSIIDIAFFEQIE